MRVVNVKLERIDFKDYPDFCDAYASYAEWDNGTPLTDDELDELNDDGAFINEEVFRQLF